MAADPDIAGGVGLRRVEQRHIGVIAGTTITLPPPTGLSIMSRDLDVMNMDVEVWDLVMAVVLRGNMLACKHVLPAMVEAGKPRRPKPTTLLIKIKNKRRTITLNIEDCDFTPIVVTM